ncbi:hypothetical protein B0H16DRAFT_1582783 [Mycena metata]|uniref:Uncharacterized protein n=1 Tax=Mycena metata TaxID=1033252 RepID=A0AAD7HZK2_9AGAR|nr:hypothetical protein B0H16DRAFT_1582783 [Mycena metata]
MWSFDDYKFEQPQRTQTFPGDAKEAAETIKRLKGEIDLLRKEREAVKLALDMAGLGVATDSDLSAVIKELIDTHSNEVRTLRKASEAGEVQREKVRKDQEAAERVLQAQHAEICHWEHFDPGSNFRSESFNPHPIVFGSMHGHRAFIARYKSDIADSQATITAILEGTVITFSPGQKAWGFQVLVGNESRLRWIPVVGRFDVGSIGYHPVPGWDKEGGTVSDTLFIARSWLSRDCGVSKVKDGATSIPWSVQGRGVEVQSFEVLCYENLR